MIKHLTPKLAEAGKIKIGGLGETRRTKKNKEFRIPKKYDHFEITTTQRDARGDLIVDEALQATLLRDADGHIRALPIVLHSDVIDEVFPTSYAIYSGRRCLCRGDGEKAIRKVIDKDTKKPTGAEIAVECPCNLLTERKCKPNGKLYCSITAPGSAVAGAVHIWRTTSIISIEQMVGSLVQIQSICGVLRNVPLWLIVGPITVEPSGEAATTVYCCHVELREADIEAIQTRALKAAETRRRLGYDDQIYKGLLTAPGEGETEEEQAEIEGEFYHEPDEARSLNEAVAGAPDEPDEPEPENEPEPEDLI